MPLFIEPDWPAPANVVALCSTRAGGCSAPPYDSLNLAHHVGDEADAVARNREVLAEALPAHAAVQWLTQVHGVAVVEAPCDAACPQADALWSRRPATACAIMTADCLPVLFCSSRGDVVAGAHAGWRGLLGGVLETTVAAMDTAPEQLLAWMGPAIGPAAFEVGPEVRESFRAACAPGQQGAVDRCFVPAATRPGHYFADLYALARLRLAAAGVSAVYGGDYCTFSDPQRFFSYRRDGVTGRMASVISLR